MKSDSYSLIDLIRDEDFISWVRNPDPLNEARWQQFLREHPEKRKTVEMAREYVNLIAEDTGRDVPTKDQSEKIWSNVRKTISSDGPSGARPEKAGKQRFFSPYLTAASVLIAALLAGYWLYSEKKLRLFTDEAAFLQHSAGEIKTDLTTRNATDKPLTILLKDGSSVILQPGSELVYDDMSRKANREVILNGSAFFEIAKETDRPFYVYSGPIVTKVLGTSFLVESSSGKTEIKVSVHSGKVSVYNKEDLIADHTENKAAGVILEKNQNITFSLSDGTPRQGSPASFDLLSQEAEPFFFEFDEAPVSEVFKALEDSYGIQIIYDKSSLSDCPLTASLTGQPLHMKLQTISQALYAGYSFTGNRVEIMGGSCN